MIAGAVVKLTDLAWGTLREAATNQAGIAAFDSLPPHQYSIEVKKGGFDTARIERFALLVRDRQSIRLELKISAAESSITVNDTAQPIGNDASQALSVDHDYFENLPLNGRNAEALVRMAPGITSAAGGRGGGFNANGLRSNMNYYTLDGLSVNSPVVAGPGGGGGRGVPGGPGGGPPPGLEAAGGTTDLISIDAMQEMRVQTSAFAPEFGRTPGAQVSMTSRGGSNNFHGSAFYYFRNEQLNANDWFANNTGIPRAQMSQNRPGGIFGGPVRRDRTFFFLNFENLRL